MKNQRENRQNLGHQNALISSRLQRRVMKRFGKLCFQQIIMKLLHQPGPVKPNGKVGGCEHREHTQHSGDVRNYYSIMCHLLHRSNELLGRALIERVAMLRRKSPAVPDHSGRHRTAARTSEKLPTQSKKTLA